MFRRFSLNFSIFSMTLDAFLVPISLAFATLVRPALSNLPFAMELPYVSTPLTLYFFFGPVWVWVFLLLSVYDGRRNFRVIDEISSITLASGLAAVVCAGALYLSYRDVSRLLFVLFVLFAYLLVLSWRMIARLIFRWRGFQAAHRRMIIIGAGEAAQELRGQLDLYSSLGLEFLGFLDDENGQSDVIGFIHEARELVTQKSVDDVIIALPGWAHERINQLVAELHDLPVKVWVIPDYLSLTLHRAKAVEFAGIPLLDLRAPALNDYQRMTKRVFDILMSILLFIPSSILMVIISIACYLDNGRPVIFKQKRAGENGKTFEMIKFRTMVENAEHLRREVETQDENGDLIHKLAKDPRVTNLGHFLRRTSLDELPQIFNVIKGEMSFVGPRPEMPYLVEKYEPWQRKRFAVPPGITGWWQVSGRSNKPMHLNTEDDLYYIQNYSFILDLYILLKTIGVVLRGEGAF
jgi:exopolysaccharide biosynthesis polyprenyl glycosylphosphotransferase